MSLSVVKNINESTLTLYIYGVMDYSTISDFDESIEIPQGMLTVIFDFSHLDFIDSTGIGSILGFLYSAQEKNLKIQFSGLSDEVRDLFETIGVFRVMEALRKGGQ